MRNLDLELSIYVYELIEDEKCETVEQLEIFSDTLHQIVENAFYEYCMDNNIEDYSPPY